MQDILVQIVFGWPAIIISLLVSILGLVWRKPRLVLAGGVIIIPFSWYLSGYPAIRSAAILLPVFQFCSAWALWKQKKMLAWLFLAPFAIVIIFLALAVLTQ